LATLDEHLAGNISFVEIENAIEIILVGVISGKLHLMKTDGFCFSWSLLPVSETGADFSLGFSPSAEDSFGGADSPFGCAGLASGSLPVNLHSE